MNLILRKNQKSITFPLPENYKRNKEIYEAVLAGETYSQIGKRYNLTRQRIGKIYKAFIKKYKGGDNR